ncbi:hypothetical protein [Kitasatospora sp. NPDC059673]|uniref:hypothetical protein n=1 Tax=Kitasatospora sp. NPDC059673 TaxID=3346901 RepID=UPI00367AE8BD
MLIQQTRHATAPPDAESVRAPGVARRLIDTLAALRPVLLPTLDDALVKSPSVELLAEREPQVLVLAVRARTGDAPGLGEVDVKSRVGPILARLALEKPCPGRALRPPGRTDLRQRQNTCPGEDSV